MLSMKAGATIVALAMVAALGTCVLIASNNAGPRVDFIKQASPPLSANPVLAKLQQDAAAPAAGATGNSTRAIADQFSASMFSGNGTQAGNGTTESPVDYSSKTFGELKQMLADIDSQVAEKKENVDLAVDGPSKDEAKLQLHAVKEQVHLIKSAIHFKKINKPALLMTAAGEQIVHRAPEEIEAQYKAATAVCAKLGGHSTDTQQAMCCNTTCAACGVATESPECSATFIKSHKLCSNTTTNRLPCMTRMLATKESRDIENKWKVSEGIGEDEEVSADGADGAAEASGDAAHPWWKFWA